MKLIHLMVPTKCKIKIIIQISLYKKEGCFSWMPCSNHTTTESYTSIAGPNKVILRGPGENQPKHYTNKL